MRPIDAHAALIAIKKARDKELARAEVAEQYEEAVLLYTELADFIKNQPTVELTSERIADLHREIRYRDQRIQELEEQIAVKDSIIKKQSIMLAEGGSHGESNR